MPKSAAYLSCMTPHCLRLEMHVAVFADALLLCNAGSNSEASTTMIATTTSNSISVNAADSDFDLDGTVIANFYASETQRPELPRY